MAAVVALAFAGCGDGSTEPSDRSNQLRITRDFGHEVLWSDDTAPLARRGTLLSQLREAHDVKIGGSGGWVEAIDGKVAREADGRSTSETTWVINVNGIETDVAPLEYRLHPGDVVQWDLRDWYVTLDVRATVGAFPQTFTNGVFGKRFPVNVRCEHPASAPCRRVTQTLREAGTPLDGKPLPRRERPPAGNPQRATVLVGAWRWMRDLRWASRIDGGARYSGVFARFAPDARSLRLLDWNAHRARTEGAGTGLIAAMRPTEEDLKWMITGVDDRGVGRAAQALDSATLRDAFALAITADGPIKLPLPPRREG